MMKLQNISLIILAIAIFITCDLGINFLFTLIPELQDGISSRSILQGIFGILGDRGWSKEKFFFIFEKSLWITYAIFVENIVAWVISKYRDKD